MNAMPVHAEKDLEICASFFEIYIGKAYDLLDRKKRLKIMENAKQHVQVCVCGCGEGVVCECVGDGLVHVCARYVYSCICI